ncbi:AAA family ATPase [Corynebacterium flavescens]
MIQLEHLHVEEFRGIRSIDLNLAAKSFVVYGPNGSGKSGIVDAIDFALTGSIARLGGDGTGGVTLLRHGPHVHRRDDPAAAKVVLQVIDTETGEAATIVRSVKTASTFTLTPDTPAMREALQEAMDHPELTLSRRELIKYIVAKPGQRAAEVQALLKLDHVETLRKSLKLTSSKASTEAKTAASERSLAEQAFQQHLGLTALLSTEVLRELNKRRETLGLSALTELTGDTDVLQGSGEKRKANSLNLDSARRDLATLRSAITQDAAIRAAFGVVQSKIKTFAANPSMMDAIRHRQLLDLGLASVENAACPLCDLPWESKESLEAHIAERIAATEAAQKIRGEVTTAAANYRTVLRGLREQAEQIVPAAREFGSGELPYLLKAWTDSLSVLEGKLDTFEAVTAHDASHSATAHVPPSPLTEAIDVLSKALDAAPDESDEDAARTFLDLAKDRWTRVCLARASAEKADVVKGAAQAAYDLYCTAADEALSTLYTTVEKDFSRYYQFVNADDEGAFRAELVPSSGSLDLKVDFYQLGMFPPVAYHSEGHQDGMGVCLYLALVKQLLGSNFKYAVLDDVVMSVDSNHRRRFAELLTTEFAGVQFIITTHDEVWARQMRASGLVKTASMARFYGWTVDAGPTYGAGDVWSAIEADLGKGDIAGAAHKLRRALEANASDIAENIGGPVTYRSDGSYDLSVFLDSIKGRHGKLLSMAASSAQSWSNQEQTQQVEQLKQRRNAVIPEQDAESWLLNKLVHNNDWANGTEADFRPVLVAAQDFLALFGCENPDCESWISVSGRPGAEGSLRCACQSYNLNLTKKK